MKIRSIILKILLPLVLGAAILYWMYRGENWQQIRYVMTDEMDWTWMLLSFPFGILAQMFRGWRWRQTLEPVGEFPRSSVSIHSIFLSYAASLVIPRVGEFTRCGVLNRYDGVSFVDRNYGIIHTLSFNDMVQSVSDYCRRNGGQLS